MKILDRIIKMASIPSVKAYQKTAVSNSIKYFEPKSIEEVPEYRVAFQDAFQFSRSLGFDPPKAPWLDTSFVDENDTVFWSACEAAGVTDMKGAAWQCLKWSHFLAPFLAQKTGCVAWLTLGQLWQSNGSVFNTSWSDLRKWTKEGINASDFKGKNGINLHAWITLQSGEIIDPTYFSTYAKVLGESQYYGQVISGRDPLSFPPYRYYPMAVGSDFAEAIGGRCRGKLLATGPADLKAPSLIKKRRWWSPPFMSAFGSGRL